VKVARRVLRGPRRSNAPGLPDLALNVIAHNLSRYTVRVGGLDADTQPTTGHDEIPATSEDSPVPDPAGEPHRKNFVATDTLRPRSLAIPGRLARSARRLALHLPVRWPWAEQFRAMLEAIRSVELVT